MEISLENFYVDTGPKPGLTLSGALPCSDQHDSDECLRSESLKERIISSVLH